MTKAYLDSVKKQFAYYQLLGEKTFAQLSDEQLFWQYNEESNSIAGIVKHLWGNMLSCWTDFLSDFDTLVYIRNQGHTVMEAINRQLAHYPYHVGQIVFIGKMARNEKWSSLSIPRGNSQAYNADKFSQPKRKEHFTDEWGTKREA